MSSDRIQILEQRIVQLEAELWALQQQSAAQRRLVAKYGQELLALIDGTSDAQVTVTDIVQKLVFQDEEGNTISETLKRPYYLV